MEKLYHIDWQQMFVPDSSVLEMALRGTIMYLAMFVLLRVFRRQAGSVSVADLLLIVIIADAAQNGMAGKANSVTEALVLICVIMFWDYALDWLGYSSRILSRVIEAEPVLLVKNGRMQRRNMKREMITEDEILSHLRLQGIDDISEVKECRLEANGEFSVIKRDDKSVEGNKKTKGGVN